MGYSSGTQTVGLPGGVHVHPRDLFMRPEFFLSIIVYIFLKCLLTVRPIESLLYFCVFVRNNTKIMRYR